ncbi:MAG: cytochrome c, partial [Pelagibacterales bacterium]|nr:cytochrome c [Pelagibacterales bacterium]
GVQGFDPNYKGKMLGNDSLADEEIWQLIDYIKKVWPTKIQDVYSKRYN